MLTRTEAEEVGVTRRAQPPAAIDDGRSESTLPLSPRTEGLAAIDGANRRHSLFT
jgi:hypothetical protein